VLDHVIEGELLGGVIDIRGHSAAHQAKKVEDSLRQKACLAVID
jgi:hypothetical protein